jgi:hypothetical protein
LHDADISGFAAGMLLKPLTATHARWSYTPNASGVEALDVEATAANPKLQR